MAPFEQAAAISPRQFGCRYGYHYSSSVGGCVRDSGSRWYDWGRWVLAGIVVIFFILSLLLLARNSRRRRRNGVPPLRGTGWMAPGPAPPYSQQPPPPQYSAAPPPQYPQGTGQKFNQNDGYYGQQEGIQLQSPPHSYQPPNQPYGGESYAPPQGPPPGR
ncbi:chitin synthesis regulation, resistance to congo red-domain-containing protein [Schizothecium vesticola]|uniref:Chitin synthesis regulation, resistance to congo red-domain-containing protein n=1 Tax=Schizothecium vesticola TaxID=314040 RepID=A0AA40K4R6_9PEZI|nr:chitin synthesis regulation, resistance to congo red-domain-containing protein [Schizothecium vesticola]